MAIAVAQRGTRIGGGERECGLGAGQSCAPRRPGLPWRTAAAGGGGAAALLTAALGGGRRGTSVASDSVYDV